MSFFLANRTDGLGSRINAMLNAMFLARELFGDLKSFRFIYTPRSSQESSSSFENNKIVRGSCDKLEAMFEEDFLQNYYSDFNETKDKSQISVCEYEDLKSLKEAFLRQDYEYFFTPIGFLHWYIKDIEPLYYRQQCSLLFEKISFRANIKQALKDAKKIDFSYTAIHYRSGDGIYGYTPISRLTGKVLTNFCSYFELILAVALKVLKERENALIIGDDLTSIQSLKAQDEALRASVEFHRSEYSNVELFFFDLALLSGAKKLYWSGSALSKIAYLLNPKLRLIPLQNVFNKKNLYKLVKYLHTRNNLSTYQKAYSLFHLFLLAKENGEKTELILEYLRACLELDYENDKYRIYYIDELLLDNQTSRAEEFLRNALELRREQFMQTLFSSYPTADNFAYGECFENYVKIKDYEKTPCLYFIASSILKNCYKQSLERKEIDLESVFVLQKPDFENKGAKEIIHNHLAYKLGTAMIRDSKSLGTYIKLPLTLLRLKKAHKEEQEKLKQNKQLPLEAYSDYKEALKEKECFTYKLGLALMKAHENRYGGGVFEFLLQRAS